MRRLAVIAAFGVLSSTSGLYAGWLPTDGGDFYYTNTVNWADGVIDNAYNAEFSAS